MKKFSYWFLLAGTVLMIVVMMRTGAPLTTTATPQGILNLEFAWNSELAARVLIAWTPTPAADPIAAAKLNTWLDFIFLFFYSFFLCATCMHISARLTGPLKSAGLLVAQAALLAGFFDILENAGMLITLSGNVYDNVNLLTTFFSVVKWLLVLLALLYIVLGIVKLALQKKQ
jgi:hypothetical protein